MMRLTVRATLAMLLGGILCGAAHLSRVYAESSDSRLEATVPEQQTGKFIGHRSFTPGRKGNVQGVVILQQGDSLILRDWQGTEVMIYLTSHTRIMERKLNPFRNPKVYETTDLMTGLAVSVDGRGNSSGGLIAETIRFSQDDLQVAHAIRTQVLPIEGDLDEMEDRLNRTDQDARDLSGQVDELVEASRVVRSEVKTARDLADEANKGVARTNDRLSALDEFEMVKTVIVHFDVGSFSLTPDIKSQLDEIANAAKARSGFVLEVTGFASADGRADLNRRLSQQRAEAVVRYLVESHQIPLRRISLPFGYGEAQPIADNSTTEGRRQNRRAEVRLLINRGLVGDRQTGTDPLSKGRRRIGS